MGKGTSGSKASVSKDTMPPVGETLPSQVEEVSIRTTLISVMTQQECQA